eukprot:gnl/TRDRNA2_/TRDRNA2_101621_c1_seq1.p2 gnl/TRDRNA2_/TRDRNA2_101621_c1~~gnl/TRDRNA2_/TRDRNA2_101621_c1_seq1.p2  ORF type:complete len:182 (-),score=34.06 gnl/TRDRNA2_/TRDRNA2_101621_c1_seq1:342-887(-)
MPFLNLKGLELARRDPEAFIHIWTPNVGRMYVNGGKKGLCKAICERWTIGLLQLEEFYRSCNEAFHRFRCPVFVISGATAKDPPDPNAIPDEATKMWLRTKADISWQPKEKGGMAAENKFWTRWTTGQVEYLEVDAPHDEIWFHTDTEIWIWRTFRGLADIDARIEADKPKKAKPRVGAGR